MDRLIRIYWPAVYSYLRWTGVGREDAAEATQAFFADVVLDRDLFGGADASRGKLRSLILTALQRYMIDRHRRKKSGPVRTAMDAAAIDHEEALVHQSPDADAQSVFDRRWALAQVQEAIDRSRAHFVSTGREANWRAFEARLILPAQGMARAPSNAELRTELGFAGDAEVSAAIQVAKRYLLSTLKSVVAESLCAGEDVEEEFERVKRVL